MSSVPHVTFLDVLLGTASAEDLATARAEAAIATAQSMEKLRPGAATVAAMDTPDRTAKLVATLQARAALAGHELVQMSDGSFIGCKPAWGMLVCLADVEAVERWLQRVGAPA